MMSSFDRSFVFSSSPLSTAHLVAHTVNWDPASPPSYAEVTHAAKELAIIYAKEAIVVPQMDREPPRYNALTVLLGPIKPG